MQEQSNLGIKGEHTHLAQSRALPSATRSRGAEGEPWANGVSETTAGVYRMKIRLGAVMLILATFRMRWGRVANGVP